MIRLVSFLLTLFVINISYADTSKETPSKHIVIGHATSFAPYSFLDENGVGTGFNVELSREIVRVMQLDAEVKTRPWGGLRDAMESGEIDALAMFHSAQREKTLDFSSVFSLVHNAIFVRQESPAIETEEELRGKDIIVIRGDIMHDYLLENGINDDPVLVATEVEALRLLASGKHDLALMAQLAGLYWVKELRLSNIRSVGPLLRPSETAYAVAKGDLVLQQELNEGLAVLQATGALKALNDKWFNVLVPPGIPMEVIVRYITFAVVVLLLLLILIMLWFHTLKKQVASRTEELRNSESRLRTLIETLPDLVWLKDKDGVYLACNSKFETLYGVKEVDLIGKSDYDFVPKEIADLFRKNDKAAEALGRPRKNEEQLTYASDGRTEWVETIKAPMFEPDGELIGILGVGRDITAHKELEDALRVAKQQFDLFMLHLPYVVAIKDGANRVVYSNPRSQEYLDTSIIGKNALETLGDEAGKEILLLSEKARVEGQAEQVIRVEIAGEVYMSRVLAFAIPQNSDEVHVGMIYIDVTRSYHDQQELRRQEEIMIAQSRHAAMGEMIGMIAHQWRQPLSVIAMGANNLLIDLELDSTSEESIKEESRSILEQTQHLSKTIDDFRDFFRPHKEMDEVTLKEVMIDAEKIIGKSLESSEVSLSIRYEATHKIKTYSRELLQVYINLLKNAKEALIEHRKTERKIEVLISSDGRDVITTICDNGGGIDEAIIGRIFDPYFTTKDLTSGTGLGLYMSKTVIEKHLHGTIEVYNIPDKAETKRLDSGACFKVSIPIDWEGG